MSITRGKTALRTYQCKEGCCVQSSTDSIPVEINKMLFTTIAFKTSVKSSNYSYSNVDLLLKLP